MQGMTRNGTLEQTEIWNRNSLKVTYTIMLLCWFS